MKQEYPKMVFKSREDNRIVNSISEQELALKDGYGDYEIVVLGRKPVKKDSPEEKKAIEAKIKVDAEKIVTDKLRESISKEVESKFEAKYKAESKARDNAYQAEKNKFQKSFQSQLTKLKSEIEVLKVENKKLEKSTLRSPTFSKA